MCAGLVRVVEQVGGSPRGVWPRVRVRCVRTGALLDVEVHPHAAVGAVKAQLAQIFGWRPMDASVDAQSKVVLVRRGRILRNGRPLFVKDYSDAVRNRDVLALVWRGEPRSIRPRPEPLWDDLSILRRAAC